MLYHLALITTLQGRYYYSNFTDEKAVASEVKKISQGHTAKRCWDWALHSCFPTMQCDFSTPTYASTGKLSLVCKASIPV